MFGLASARRQSLRTAAGEPWDIAAVPPPAAFVPESMAVYNALETFKAANVRVALVLSEHGGVEGLLTVDAFNALGPLGPLPLAPRGEYQTLGGFVFQLGRLPEAGDRFAWGRRRFEVLDLDCHRVDQVRVTPDPHVGTGG